jgi:predicted CoA-binding protein
VIAGGQVCVAAEEHAPSAHAWLACGLIESAAVSASAIDEFLAGRRLALIGVSVVPGDASRTVLSTLRRRGHDIVPIRAGVDVLDGRRAYPTVAAVPGRLDGAVVMTAPHLTERAIYECAERGIQHFWLDPGGLRGVHPEALELCARRKLVVAIGGELPVESAVQRLRRESKQLVQAMVLAARLRVSD